MPKRITLDDLAAMVGRGFKDVHQELIDFRKEFNQFKKENKREHEQLRKAIGNLAFIATEMVRREEFISLLKRVERLETQLKGQ